MKLVLYRCLLGQMLTLLLPLTVFAGNDHEIARQLKERGKIVPLEVILNHSKSIQNARLLEVELEQEGKQIRYEIELLTTEGKVLELVFNARTGVLLNSRNAD